MRLLPLALLVFASGVAAQSTPPDVLPDSIRQRLQLELAHMNLEDQRVRYMEMVGTFSPCVADSVRLALKDLPAVENFQRSQELRAEAAARISPEEKAVLLQIQRDTDAAIFARLMAITAEHGWPSDERTGADMDPVVFLLHSPNRIEDVRDLLLAEIQAGRMPAREFAMARDKWRKVQGLRQLYGTGDEYDAATQTIMPPTIDSIEATNAARREIGMEPLAEYRLADS